MLKNKQTQNKQKPNKATRMVRRKSPPSEQTLEKIKSDKSLGFKNDLKGGII